MSDVHSKDCIDGDGEVVGRHFEGERAIRQDIQLCCWSKNKHNCFSGWSHLTVGKDDGPHVDEVSGHHVKVGVGVLPNREGRRCYSGL